jgi:hypothetical protein
MIGTLQWYSLHDTTRRQKTELNEAASTHRLFQNRFKGTYMDAVVFASYYVDIHFASLTKVLLVHID